MSNHVVLLIEDEEMVIDVASMMLIRLGCEVEVSKTGSEAIAAMQANSNKFDFMIVDFNLPDMTAIECLTEIRKISKTPAILSSGYGNNLSEEECDALIVKAILSKPFSLSQLEAVLESVSNPQA